MLQFLTINNLIFLYVQGMQRKPLVINICGNKTSKILKLDTINQTLPFELQYFQVATTSGHTGSSL